MDFKGNTPLSPGVRQREKGALKLSFMIGAVMADHIVPIDLFQHEQTGHLMGEGEVAELPGVRQLKIHKSSKSGLVAAFFVSSP